MIREVRVEGLKEFRAALRAAEAANPRVLTAAIKAAGVPPVERAAALSPVGGRADDKHKGALKSGWRTQARGPVGNIISKAPYGGGAVWGTHGKWRGFAKYGPPGRFAWQAVEETAPAIIEIITARLHSIIDIYGWAKGKL